MAAPLSIGAKTERVRIESVATTTSDTGGQVDGAVTVVATVLAAIRGLGIGQEREVIAAGGAHASLTHEIVIDYLAGIRPTMRVVETAGAAPRTFEIVEAAQHDARRRETHLHCVERVI